MLFCVSAFISKDTITGFSAWAKQLVQIILFVIFLHFSAKKSTKMMMMKGAQWKAKVNTCPTFRGSFRQAHMWASMENVHPSNFRFSLLMVQKWQHSFYLSTSPVVTVHSDLKTWCNLVGKTRTKLHLRKHNNICRHSEASSANCSCWLKKLWSLSNKQSQEKNHLSQCQDSELGCKIHEYKENNFSSVCWWEKNLCTFFLLHGYFRSHNV